MNSMERIRLGRRKRRLRRRTASAALGALVLTLAVLSLVLGKTIYPFRDMIRALSGEEIRGVTFAVHTLRLPRMLAGTLTGIALGISGTSFQTMLRNSLASPDVIGVTSGAGAAAVFCILVLRWSGPAVSAAAVIAGLAVAALIFLTSGGGSFGGGRMILIGIGIGAMLNAFVSYLLMKASDYDVPAALRWLSGSLNGVRMKELPPIAIAVAVLGPAAALLGDRLRVMELGEEAATALGVPVRRTRLLLTLCAVGLAAFAATVTGPVAFVAFLSGPIAARLAGSGRAGALPSALTGAALVLGADLLGQFAFETRFPVGVITGILGAPYLIFLLIGSNRKGGSI
ncbi:MAG: iron chelate uptake ABC transporter family permease subunit [Clostridium sp.]|jgi:iron complex transport system permease protein|nr:iron chelate uptake ABC transporter family permease subunit [Clostridium sp.]